MKYSFRWIFLSTAIFAVGVAIVDEVKSAKDNDGKVEEDQRETWYPRARVHGWGADRHLPALRVKDSDRPSPARDRLEWKEWRTTLGSHRIYLNVSDEELHARIFEETEQMVSENLIAYAKGEASYYLEVNKFADLTQNEAAEFGCTLTNFAVKAHNDLDTSTNETMPENDNYDGSAIRSELATTVDWRPFLTPVKNQGGCGSCYAFSAMGAVEAQIAKVYNVKMNLSEQSAVDCSLAFGNFGCSGGWMHQVYEWLVTKNLSIPSSSQYPYSGRVGTCESSKKGIYRIKGYQMVQQGEVGLRSVVSQVGPAAVAFCADGVDFFQYRGGVYSNPKCPTQPNHAVIAVGYGTENNNAYWIIRNSWGADWGDNGYIRMKRGVNQCGIEGQYNSYPIIA